jgi:HEAT repeat protein
MVRFYCPKCWINFAENLDLCPQCGLDIRQFWASKDYVEKLILALNHPEKTTPIRTAWILGKLREPRAAKALNELIEKTDDVYLVVAAVKALGEIGTLEAIASLEALRQHPAKMVREACRKILEQISAEHVDKEGA